MKFEDMLSRRAAMALAGAVAGTAAAPKSMAAGREPRIPIALAEADFEHLIVKHRRVTMDGVEIFYREAGRVDAPALLLLHGFPASSHMFRHLIPALADRFRIVAPDYPGFGFSAFPARDAFAYSFANIARIMSAFVDAVGLIRFALYIQDYGAPIGMRMALRHPERVSGLIVQNGNIYEEGLSPGWDPLKAYWRNPSANNRAALRGWLGADGTKFQYSAGVPATLVDRLAPETWSLDWALMSRPGNIDVQLDLFGDYRTNVDLYPDFQRYLREHQPPTLIAWGRRDPFFTEAGALAYLRDVPGAEMHLIDGSHFLLETHSAFVAHLIRRFLTTSVKAARRASADDPR